MTKDGTAIEWTHVPGYRGETWNPVTGCDRVSPGCAHCYALELAGRLKGMGQPRYQRDGDPKTSGPGFAVTLHEDKLLDPLRWAKPRAVFVNSMSDVFHEAIPDDFVIEMFNTMAKAPQHIFMVLTKRPERMQEMIEKTYETLGWPEREPLPNVWLGVTIENRRFVDRADLLRETPAAVRFISAEPLLGPLIPEEGGVIASRREDGEGLDLTGIDWLIVGGESGPVHRTIKEVWIRRLREAAVLPRIQRATARDASYGLVDPYRPGDTAFFFKQWGGRTPKAGGRELDGREWSEFPVAAVAA